MCAARFVCASIRRILGLRLSELVAEFAWHSLSGLTDVEIRGLTADSRAVEPGYLFAALPGSICDGRDFIADAVDRGAVAVLAPPDTEIAWDRGNLSTELLTDDNPRRLLSLLAARFYGRQPATTVAVTGTSGKTSVVEFARQIWEHLGHRAASLGTLGITAPGFVSDPGLTTPNPVLLHRTLAELAQAGIEHAAIEASSHGLDQFRLDGVRLSAAVFTNLGRDHLDYHRDTNAYLAAKQRLFEVLLPSGAPAVLNADTPEFEALRALCYDVGNEVVSYGRAGSSLHLDDLRPLASGQRLVFTLDGCLYDTRLPLVGEFQAMNALAALALVTACGVDTDRAVGALAHLVGVRGRVELVAYNPNGAAIYVDYAHTPEALEAVLSALRPHVTGKLTVVFGAGGDRDSGKRASMGVVVSRLADRAIITDDNPRTEDPAAVRAQILVTCPMAREIGDRRTAIETAVNDLGSDDILLIAGKGHEEGQLVGVETLPFDDAQVARQVVAVLTEAKRIK